LTDDVNAGTYHVDFDSIVFFPVDVTYELIHRHASGAPETQLATWSQHWEPLPGGVYEAQQYEIDVTAPAIDAEPGDQFVLRFTGTNSIAAMAYLPNGDGERAGGDIPNITFPR
jgi:hypothetical protein